MRSGLTSAVTVLGLLTGCFGSLEDPAGKPNLAQFRSPTTSAITVSSGTATLTVPAGTSVTGQETDFITLTIADTTDAPPVRPDRTAIGGVITVGPSGLSFSTGASLVSSAATTGQFYDVVQLVSGVPTVVCPLQPLTSAAPSCSSITQTGSYAFYSASCYTNPNWPDSDVCLVTGQDVPVCPAAPLLGNSFWIEPSSFIDWIEPMGIPSLIPSFAQSGFEGWITVHPTAQTVAAEVSIITPVPMTASWLTQGPAGDWTLWLRPCDQVGLGITGIQPTQYLIDQLAAGSFVQLAATAVVGTLNSDTLRIEIQDARAKTNTFIDTQTPFAEGLADAQCPLNSAYIGTMQASLSPLVFAPNISGGQGGTPLTNWCGSVSLDQATSARGYWYVSGNPQERLALVPDQAVSGNQELLAPATMTGGDVISNLTPGVYTLAVESDAAEPTFNVPFSLMTPATAGGDVPVYCFDSFVDSAGTTVPQTILVMSFPDTNKLVVEAQAQSSCANAAPISSGVTFVR